MSLVVDLLCDLIRFDTTNRAPGDANGERECAESIAAHIRDAGFEPVVLAPDDAPHRASVVVRVPGVDRSLPGLLVQGHTDVVPAEAEQWSVDPFAGVVRDGFVIGRGAMDMKDTVASALATIIEWGQGGERPRRDVVFAFVADEETDGRFGAGWLVAHHPELFEGVEAAIGEDGAMYQPATAAGGSPVHLYQIACGERGVMQFRITATGRSGHGSRPTGDDAVTKLIACLYRLSQHRWPLQMSPVVEAQLRATADALGLPLDLADEASIMAVPAALGPHAGALAFTVRTSSVATIVDAGYKVNVIPDVATAEVDVRVPPGFEDEVHATLSELIGDEVEWEYTSRGDGIVAPTSGPWFDAMADALRTGDPEAVVVPYCMGGGTDAKSFSTLGIACYGFTPHTPAAVGVAANYHGVDERIPVEALEGGHAILHHFVTTV